MTDSQESTSNSAWPSAGCQNRPQENGVRFSIDSRPYNPLKIPGDLISRRASDFNIGQFDVERLAFAFSSLALVTSAPAPATLTALHYPATAMLADIPLFLGVVQVHPGLNIFHDFPGLTAPWLLAGLRSCFIAPAAFAQKCIPDRDFLLARPPAALETPFENFLI